MIVLASDHNGVELKNVIKAHLKKCGLKYIDLGPYEPENSVDYTDYAFQLSTIIKSKEADKGILICGTGVGMSIAANRVSGVRAALVHNLLTAPKCREHNDSNVLCLGSWVTDDETSINIVNKWLDTEYGEKRHVRRVEKLNKDKKEKIVFANGVFDILHSGHIELLRFAKNLGGKLIVAVNSDKSVKKLKGDSRPINSEMDRLKLIQSLRWVDDAFVFDSCETKEMIEAIQPDVVVKGGEWTAAEVRERDEIPDQVDVKIFPLKSNYSTTNTLQKVTSWQKKSS